MSKEAALRAMREARYAERNANPAAPRRLATPAARSTAPPASEPIEASGTAGLCGHRSMNGRTCTREAGHEAKSHRYG
jgi:hypothetical protein